MTAIARATRSSALLPFPDLRMGWGLDAHWGAVAERARLAGRRRRRHARPPRRARSPAATRATRRLAEARAFLAGRPYLTRERGRSRPLEAHTRVVRVAVVAEYYPRAADPVLGVWAHRQALAARDAGAEVRVLVLHRPVPSRAALARPATRAR